jgi:YesN/AraC family two-component response regulator
MGSVSTRVNNQANNRAKSGSGGSSAGSGLNEVPVLLADDEPLMRQLLASILRSIGYTNITHVTDGPQALAAIKGDGVRIAFLDIDMPGYTGLEVMALARATHPDCFFVIVSAHSAVENVLGALNGGARGFIVKPFNAQKIHDVLLKFGKQA